ncbi:MAG TPA: tetratricopeptide repeat protein, partial [Flavobacteriales bacterium]|nr:tetratricopeptide repeat protein [Flavobacteriales bacterium]
NIFGHGYTCQCTLRRFVLLLLARLLYALKKYNGAFHFYHLLVCNG